MTREQSHQDGDSSRPYWIPTGVDFDRFPAELRTAIREIINPAYRELVEQARDGLEKSAGLTVIWLLWLEIVDHIQMAHTFTTARSIMQMSEEREQLITRHLRLAGSKIKASSFLLSLHAFEQEHGLMPGCSPNAGASIDPDGGESAETEG